MIKLTQKLTIAIVLFSLQFALASNWTNGPTSTAYLGWNDADNWDAGVPNAIGDEANIYMNITNMLRISLASDVTVGNMKIGDTESDPIGYAQEIEIGSSDTYTLTLDSGNSNNGAYIEVFKDHDFERSYYEAVTFRCPLKLAGTAGATINISGSVDFYDLNLNGKQLTFESFTNVAPPIYFYRDLEGNSDSSLIISDNITVTASSIPSPNYFGEWIVKDSSYSSLVGSVLLSAKNVQIDEGAKISIGSNSTVGTNPGQRFPTNKVTMSGGELAQGGQPLKDAAVNGLVGDYINTAIMESGNSYITFTGKPTGANGTYVNFGSLQTEPGSVLCVRGDSLGLIFDSTIKGQQLIITNFTAIGGGGVAETTTMSVIPKVFCNNTSDTHAPGTIATYSTNGVRGLEASEYFIGGNLDAAIANDNVSIDSGVTPLITSDKTINSLQVIQYKTANIGAGRTLTVQSGSVLMQTKTTLGAINNANAGTLNFGTREGTIFWNNTNLSTAIGSVIAGSAGLTIAGGMSTSTEFYGRLTGANIYTGSTYIYIQNLDLGDGTLDTATACFGEGDVYVGSKSKVTIKSNVADAIDDSYSLYIKDNYNSSQIILETGINEKVANLYINDEAQAAGTYGSTSSSATYQNDVLFSGAGIITVLPKSDAGTLLIIQ